MPYEILIVHQDKQTAETVLNILRKKGNRVTPVRDIQKAFCLIEKKEYDLVISDLELSGGSGLEILEKNKARHPLSEVIIITDSSSLESAVASSNDAAAAYILKPLHPDHFWGRTEKILQKRSLALLNRNLLESVIRSNIELRRKADELKEAYSGLERMQKRLVRTERLAAIGEITVSLKHEINNPLAVIISGLDFLSDKMHRQSNDGKRLFKLINREAYRIHQVLEKLDGLKEPVTTDYLKDVKMIDLGRV